jgi:PAS domain S-box-containing protein/putative nucleotidyltransferase with HDIG domain
MKLRVKLPLVYTLLIAVLGAAFVVFTSCLVERRMVEEEHEYFGSLAKTLAMNTANAIALRDYAALREFVDNMAHGEHVRYAIILDDGGAVLAHSRRELEGILLDDPVSRAAAAADELLTQPDGADTLDVTAPLHIAGRKWGAVRIGYSLTEMQHKVAQARNVILFAGLLATLAGAAVAIFVARRITAPLHALHRGTEIIGAGDLDYQLAVSADDEIGQLATAFNAMSGQLHRNYQAIERAKHEWETSIDAVPDPLFIHDREFRVMRCNRAYANAAGMSYQEIIGRPYYEMFPKMDGPTEGCRKALELQEDGEEEIFVHAVDRVFNAKAHLVRDVDGAYLYSLHILQDVTAKKKAEEASRESEEKFRAISDGALDAVLMLDDDGRIVYWNPAAGRIFGYSLEEALGQEAHILLAPRRYHDASRGGWCVFHESGLGPVIGKVLELSALRKDGTEFPIELSVSALKIKGRWHAVGILRDVTTRKQAEGALKESEERYRRITEGLTDYQYTVRVENGRPVETTQSPACVTVTGYMAEEYAANPYLWIQMVVPEDRERVMQHVQRILAGQDVSPIEHRITRKNGETRWISDTTILFKDNAGKLLSYDGVIKDITGRKKAEKEFHELFLASIESLASAIEAKSPWTRGHSERVADYAAGIGQALGLTNGELEKLRIAALLHDIGKIGTYDSLLEKPGKLTDVEYESIKQHPGKGAEMLAPISQLHDIIPWIRGHHERFDGKGYPDGLKGEDIPLQARILAAADTFDSMTAERPYRATPGKAQALEEIQRHAGTQFDPKVVEAFLRTDPLVAPAPDGKNHVTEAIRNKEMP